MSKKHITELVGKIKEEKLISIDDNGIGALNEGAIEKLLPEGLDKDTFDKASEATRDIGDALIIAFGQQSKAVFDKNKKVEQTVFKAQVNKNTGIEANVKREHSYTHKFNKDANGNPVETTVKVQGYSTFRYDVSGSMSDKAIRKEIQSAWNLSD